MCTYTVHCVWIARFSMNTVFFFHFSTIQIKYSVHTHCYAFNGLIHVACVWTALKRRGHSVPYIYKSTHRYIQTYIYCSLSFTIYPPHPIQGQHGPGANISRSWADSREIMMSTFHWITNTCINTLLKANMTNMEWERYLCVSHWHFLPALVIKRFYVW